MTRKHLSVLILCSVVAFVVACTSNEIGNSKDVNPEAVYLDYEVLSGENSEEVTVNLQFRMGGANGTTLVLDEPSKVTLDGEQLSLDSAKLMGAYYEIQKNRTTFNGKHIITFTDLNGKEFQEEFEFSPFTMDPDVPATLTRGDLVFNFKGLEPVEYITVLMTDTSFGSSDINELDTVRDGKLVIKADRLNTVVNGPINLQFYREITRRLKNGTKEGGRILLTYTLKREFELKDAFEQ